MQILWIFSFSLLAVYMLRILTFLAGWHRTARKKHVRQGHPAVSVVIAVRNEEENLGLLMEDLVRQDYPRDAVEIIVVDDHSDDSTPELAGNYRDKHSGIRTMSLDENETGKKAALHKGIQAASHQLILSVDGDCRADSRWVAEMIAGFSDPKTKLVIGGVIFEPDRRTFPAMQSLEHFSLTAVSAGAAGLDNPILCSGANLAFYREDYLEFSEEVVKASVSGDDIFLMLWLKKKYPGSAVFSASPHSAIRTRPSGNLSSFTRQRLRWTSKSPHYRDPGIIGTALVVFGMNAVLLVLLLTLLLAFLRRNPGAGSWNNGLLLLFGILLAGKAAADILLLLPVLKHYGKIRLLWFFLPLEIVYFMYVSLTGIAGPFLPLLWKGRNIPARQKKASLGKG